MKKNDFCRFIGFDPSWDFANAAEVEDGVRDTLPSLMVSCECSAWGEDTTSVSRSITIAWLLTDNEIMHGLSGLTHGH